MVEITHDADPLRVRRPNSEVYPSHACHLSDVRAQLFVLQVMRALCDQVQVEVGQQRREGIRIVDSFVRAVPVAAVPAIRSRGGQDPNGGRNYSLEETVRMNGPGRI